MSENDATKDLSCMSECDATKDLSCMSENDATKDSCCMSELDATEDSNCMSESDIINEWLLVAYDDYDSAKFLCDNKLPKPLEIICYHCQQSAEKSLKAYLCANDADIPRTHEVKKICTLCSEIDDSFSALFDDCEELEVYATETRYPLRIEIDDTHAARALRQALTVYEFVSKKIDEMQK